jgi:hypothetical protein
VRTSLGGDRVTLRGVLLDIHAPQYPLTRWRALRRQSADIDEPSNTRRGHLQHRRRVSDLHRIIFVMHCQSLQQ